MNIDWIGILATLKEISGFRFYFIVSLIFLLTLSVLFKDEISVKVQETTFKKVEFNEIRDLKGLEVNLNTLMDTTMMRSYTVYIYQPKDKSYYKTVAFTNSDLVKTLTRLRGGYLEEQQELTELLNTKGYGLLSFEDQNPSTAFLHELGINYMWIQKIGPPKKVYGEVRIDFKKKPTEEYLKELRNKLALANNLYVY